MRKVVVVVAALAVLGALGGGFYLIGPPADERARRLDARRQNDLQQLSRAVNVYWTRNSRLPTSLDEISREAGADVYSRDPERGEAYEYTQKSSDSYEICATFTGDSDTRADFWSHGAGRQCFRINARTVRP